MRTDRSILQFLAKECARFQKGNALVEFALILPLFLLLFMGMASYSIALYNKNMLLMASREGARAGIIFSAGITPANRMSTAITVAQNACRSKCFSFGVSGDPVATANIIGNILTVTATYNYIGLPVPLLVLPESFSISAETAMRLETTAP